MTTATATVQHYEVCVRDAWDVSVVHYTTKDFEHAQACAAGIRRSWEPRIIAIYTDGSFARVA